MSTLIWPVTPLPPALADDEAHVWAIPLDVPGFDWQAELPRLADDEQQRARRFRIERVSRRFVAARSALRRLLAAYLGSRAEEVAFVYGDLGKPTLDPARHNAPLHFNLTHSHDLALLAVTRLGPLGVDVEHLRPLRAAEAMARRFFAAAEVATFFALPDNMQLDGFYRCWTRKEAYLKAQGLGIGQPLDRFEVSLVPGEEARLLCVAEQPSEAARWHMAELLPASDYVGALAMRLAPPRLRTFAYA